jgi:hypothetical protein
LSHRVGENAVSCTRKLLDLVEASGLETRRCVAVADDVWRHEGLKGLGAAAVPCAKKIAGLPPCSLMMKLSRCCWTLRKKLYPQQVASPTSNAWEVDKIT